MTAESKTRIQVALTKEMVEKIDLYASKMGVSRSMLCALALGQYVMTLDTAIEKFKETMDE